MRHAPTLRTNPHTPWPRTVLKLQVLFARPCRSECHPLKCQACECHRPSVDIHEQCAMYALQVGQVVRRELKLDLARGQFGEVPLGLKQLVIVQDIQPIAQNRCTWIAVGILADTVLVQESGLPAVLLQEVFAGRKCASCRLWRDVVAFKSQAGGVIGSTGLCTVCFFGFQAGAFHLTASIQGERTLIIANPMGLRAAQLPRSKPVCHASTTLIICNIPITEPNHAHSSC